MKLFIKLMILTLLLAMAGPFFIDGPDGKPLLRIGAVRDDLARQANAVGARLSTLTASLRARLTGSDESRVTVYKWQDENGQWHFSNLPPGVDGAESITINADANVIDALPTTMAEPPAATTQPPALPSLPSPLSVTPTQLDALINDAKQLHETAAERDAKTRDASLRD